MPSELAVERIKQYCLDQDYPYFPELTEKPHFAEVVDRFIRDRGRRDLPPSQFENEINYEDPSSLVEMIGLLGYNEDTGLFEVEYREPNLPGHAVLGPVLNWSKLIKADYVIQYHSHPVGKGELSKGDAKSMGATLALVQLVEMAGGDVKDLFFNVYLPHTDSVIWYKVKRI